MKKFSWILICSLLLSIIGIFLIFYFALNESFNDGSNVINPDLASNYGSFISGIVGSIFTLVGFLLLYQTILEQRKQFNIQQFESSIFEMIRYHRENIQEIVYISSSSKEEKSILGRNVFIELKKQILDLYGIITKSSIIIDKLKEEDILNITYLIFFFGVSERTKETTKERILKTKLLIENDIDLLINKIREKKTKYNNKIVYFGGHQSKLGFYFRHIYRTIKLIDENPNLSENQKKYYAKIFRSQLSNYEQGLFFFNSLSDLGKAWRKKDKNGISLIEKYELIKNIPPKFLDNIDFKSFYSNIEYEYG